MGANGWDHWGNKTFRPQDVSPLVIFPLVVSPPFWFPSRFASNPSRFAPKPFPIPATPPPPPHTFFYVKDLLTLCETERKGERENMYFEWKC